MPGLEALLRSFARRYVIAFALTAALMVGAVVMVNYVIDQKIGQIKRVNVNTQKTSSPVVNFLLIGSDTRAFVKDSTDQAAFGSEGQAGGQRSDTLMVVHIDPGHGRAVVVSFPRDLWVDIPGVGKSKINAAFNTGPDTVIQTLKNNFDIPINHYIEIDFKSFEGIVDAIGTVPVYFPYPVRDDDTGLYSPVAGCKLLDGKAALAYARARHLRYYSFPRAAWLAPDASADLARIKRQQDFMRRLASIAVAKSLNDPITANNVVDEILTYLKVDDSLGKEDLLALIDAFRNVNPDDSSKVQFLTLPSRNGSAGNLSVLYAQEPDATAVLTTLRDTTGDVTSTAPTTTAPATATGPSATTGVASGTVTTTTAAPTPVPIQNKSQLGPPAANAAPC